MSTSLIGKELLDLGNGELLLLEKLEPWIEKHLTSENAHFIQGVIFGYTVTVERDILKRLPTEKFAPACKTLMERWEYLSEKYKFRISNYWNVLDLFCPNIIDCVRKQDGFNDTLDAAYAQGDNPIMSIAMLKVKHSLYEDKDLAAKVICVQLLREYLFMQRHLPKIGIVNIIGAVSGLMEKWDTLFPDSDMFFEQLNLIAPKVTTVYLIKELENVIELARDANSQDSEGNEPEHDPVLPDGAAVNT